MPNYGGVLATAYYVVHSRLDWWLGVGVAWSLLQLIRLDFDAHPDGFMLVLWVAVGIGLAASTLTRGQQRALLVGVLSLTAGQMAVHDHWYWSENAGEPDLENPRIEAFMSEEYPPETCLVTKGGIDRGQRIAGRGLPQTCEGVDPDRYKC